MKGLALALLLVAYLPTGHGLGGRRSMQMRNSQMRAATRSWAPWAPEDTDESSSATSVPVIAASSAPVAVNTAPRIESLTSDGRSYAPGSWEQSPSSVKSIQSFEASVSATTVKSRMNE